eukprot:CAMPEP_0194769798 /NCGR_PEP_ID=MMETSP0323_2-20130528/44287_1 /TAXON_ID=2866 ORGANISM="Crypthecodinium cohnii, Strain Seligo" /NCGR_SAMPLE_ID=MMETSP0323_2 /ASSEMBLY_ACC=CAM_ASM_000346 /LENGTH=67 /DNA_ID=CAMNT_0039702995 /DNA_START=346 /DNA_END=549 /DNA_ORIENTATION=+
MTQQPTQQPTQQRMLSQKMNFTAKGMRPHFGCHVSGGGGFAHVKASASLPPTPASLVAFQSSPATLA